MPDKTELEIDITKDPGDILDTNIDLDPSEPAIGSEPSSEDIDAGETTPEDKIETPKKGKNKSNFKKLAKANKAKDKIIAEQAAKLKELEGGNADDDDEDLETDEPTYDRVDLLEFITDTEGAAAYKDQIKEALEEFPGISFEKALIFVKSQGPETSTSRKSFSAKSGTPNKTKKLKDLTAAEVAKADLTPQQVDSWKKSQGEEKNPF